MSIKKNKCFVTIVIVVAVVLGIALGVYIWPSYESRDKAIQCLQSGGIVVIQERGHVECVDKKS